MPSASIDDGHHLPHVALLPSAGMGHVTPFCRLAAALATRCCTVSFIAMQPTVSNAESLAIAHLLDTFPTQIRRLDLPLVALDLSSLPPSSTSDPFFLRFEAVRRSAHLLPSLLASASAASSSPISALIIDNMSACTFVPVAKDLNLQNYILFTNSAAMLSFFAYLPTYTSTHATMGDVHVPGFRTIPKASILPPLDDPNHIFSIGYVNSGRTALQADGVLLNSFRQFEPEAINALDRGLVVPCFPQVFPVGMLRPVSPPSPDKITKISSPVISWLDEQPDESVVYVSFGSRTATTEEQIREIGEGLERSGQRFLWVVKTKKVDREEEKEGKEYVEPAGGKGLVVNGWVEQEEVLRHRAVGGFVSHCGWNSVTEAAMAGKRVLAWPRGLDQRVNGEVVRRSGLGIWMEKWSCGAEEGVVRADEVARKVRELMEDEGLKESAARIGMQAERAVGGGGTSETALERFIARVMMAG